MYWIKPTGKTGHYLPNILKNTLRLILATSGLIGSIWLLNTVGGSWVGVTLMFSFAILWSIATVNFDKLYLEDRDNEDNCSRQLNS